jgi:hypothetical protein
MYKYGIVGSYTGFSGAFMAPLLWYVKHTPLHGSSVTLLHA